MSTERLIYFIIINWNNLPDTLKCLQTIKENCYKNYKIILINNSPQEEGVESLKTFDKLEVINNKTNVGFAKANNQGIQRAIADKADYVLILNNDTTVDKYFLPPLISACEDNPKTIVSPSIYLYNSVNIDSYGGRLIYWAGIARLIKRPVSKPPDYLSGACLLCKTDYFSDIGLFNDDFFCYYEDMDWALRAQKKGYNLRIVYPSKIWHKSSASTKTKKGWGPIKFYYMARNNLLLADKNFMGYKKFFWILAYLILGSNLHLVFFCRGLNALKHHYLGMAHGLKKVFSAKAQ